MMDEYIKRQYVLDEIDEKIEYINFSSPYQNEVEYVVNGLYRARDSVEYAPIEDVVPVRHGRWEEYEYPHIVCCSECDWATGVEEKHFNYCPNCGAKMDGDNNG